MKHPLSWLYNKLYQSFYRCFQSNYNCVKGLKIEIADDKEYSKSIHYFTVGALLMFSSSILFLLTLVNEDIFGPLATLLCLLAIFLCYKAHYRRQEDETQD